jgi:hypothetical protein
MVMMRAHSRTLKCKVKRLRGNWVSWSERVYGKQDERTFTHWAWRFLFK